MEQTIFTLLLALLLSFVSLAIGFRWGRRRERPSGLAANEQHFQQIIEAAPVGICIVRERRFAFVNDAYLRMFGYDSAEEVIGRFVEELYAERERERQRGYARGRIAGKPVPTMYETVGLRKNGEEFEVSAWVSLVRYHGQLSSLGFVIDRSVEKEMRRRLDQANRLEAMGRLAGGIAHDFNNILTAIIGYSELALMRSRSDPRVLEDVEKVLLAGKRAKELVRQILLFSRKQEQLMRVVHVSAVVDEVVQLIRATLPTSITLHVETGREVNILADPTGIHQLVLNLCANAEHAMRATGGSLCLGVKEYIAGKGSEKEYPGLTPGAYALLQVSDTGTGISPAIKEKIFEPFFTTKEIGEGTGMGLAQVHAIVTSHGGSLFLTENRPHGSLFSVFFPLIAGKEEVRHGDEARPGAGRGRILLVEDEAMVLEVTERMLCELGYDVVAYGSAEDALAHFAQDPKQFDLVISDMTMPQMTGDKLALQIKGLRPDVPFILCTGYSAVIDEDQLIGAIVTILEKPVDKDVLAKTVDSLLLENRSLQAT